MQINKSDMTYGKQGVSFHAMRIFRQRSAKHSARVGSWVGQCDLHRLCADALPPGSDALAASRTSTCARSRSTSRTG